MTFALLLLSYALQDAGHVGHLQADNKCSYCARAGVKSKVYPKGCHITAMGCLPYYNENGVLVSSACNTSTCSYICSNNHYLVNETKVF